MKLVVNGEAREVALVGAGAASVDAMLSVLGFPKERVAVELNGDIVVKADRSTMTLKDGDVIEVVTLVGGG